MSRLSINFSDAGHRRLKLMTKEVKLSQSDLLSVICEEIDIDQVKAIAASARDRVKAEKAQRKELRNRMSTMSSEEIDKLLAEIGR